jgi:hypothetical protein
MHYMTVVWVVCCLPCSLIPCISFLSLYMCNIFSCFIKSLALNGSFVLFLPLFPSCNFLYIILFFHVPGGVVKNWALWDFIKLRTFFWLCNLSPFLHQNLAKGTSEHHRSIQNPPVSPTTASRILFEVINDPVFFSFCCYSRFIYLFRVEFGFFFDSTRMSKMGQLEFCG